VANADQLVIVCALADPEPNLRFIDRCLVAAYDAGLDPLLVLTKADLDRDPPAARSAPSTRARPADADHQAAAGGPDPGPAQVRGDRRISVLIGPSGVGKSTLMNTLVPEAARATGRVNPVTGQGRHTSSSLVAIPLDDGWLIDTPGLRGFGLGHVSPERVAEASAIWPKALPTARPGAITLPGCALDQWAREHHAEARLDSLRRLLRSREGAPD